MLSSPFQISFYASSENKSRPYAKVMNFELCISEVFHIDLLSLLSSKANAVQHLLVFNFSVLGDIKLNNVTRKFFKENMKCGVNFTHFKFYFK